MIRGEGLGKQLTFSRVELTKLLIITVWQLLMTFQAFSHIQHPNYVLSVLFIVFVKFLTSNIDILWNRVHSERWLSYWRTWSYSFWSFINQFLLIVFSPLMMHLHLHSKWFFLTDPHDKKCESDSCIDTIPVTHEQVHLV